MGDCLKQSPSLLYKYLNLKSTMKIKNFFLILLCLSLGLSAGAKNKTKVIAHRGYWKIEGSAQNSIKSLEEADRIKVYGSEFDVHLTADNEAIVFHDNKVNDIKVQEVNYDKLKDIQLANGEKIPTLDQYLQKGKKLKKAKLIFELKSHATPQRDREAAAFILNKIKEYKLQKKTEYIAFSLEAAKEIIRLDKKAKVSYLNGELSPKELKSLGFAGLDYNYNVIKKHPEWVKEAKDLDLTVNVWTVNTAELMQEMIALGVDYITTDYPELLQQELKK